MPLFYLASKSPRRREILASMGLTDIELLPVGDLQLTAFDGDEEMLECESAENYVIRTAREKALGAFRRIELEKLPVLPVLSADTTVIADGEILGKPRDRQQAREFMHRLSGRRHEVRTAVFFGDSPDTLRHQLSVSQVHFSSLSEDSIERYIATAEPYDKAGGYGIQGLAGLFIDAIEGSYSGIMGLPVFETAQLLRPYGFLPV